MPTLVIENLSDNSPLDVLIEPWADLAVLAPDTRAYIDYNDPAEIVFSYLKEGRVAVSVDSDRITIRANGAERSFVT